MIYQVLYGYTQQFIQIIECKNDEEAVKVAHCIYAGWQSNQSMPGFCVLKRGREHVISNRNFDILVSDCM